MLRYLVVAAMVGLLAGCGSDDPPPVAPPSVELPADMPPLACADFEPPPVAKPTEKFTGRKCTNADGSMRWINGFYQCTDGRIWPLLAATQQRPVEPTDPAFDQCIGRT